MAASLYCILAREAPVGVIFRRGPTRQVQLILWNTKTDAFTEGQWFKGRIYERRSDLSPDGNYLGYFAANHRTKEYDKATWTAISKPPYLTALALWWKGESYCGGGLFPDNTRFALNSAYENDHRYKGDLPKPLLKIETITDIESGDWPIERRRLQRDGWATIQEMERYAPRKSFILPADVEPGSPEAVRLTTEFFDEQERSGESKRPQVMVKKRGVLSIVHTLSVGKTKDISRYRLESESGESRELARATWADFDHRGRVVYTAEGKIYTLEKEEPKVLADFNTNTFTLVKPPKWATRW